MYVDEHKSFERFVRLAPLRFDGTTGEKAYDFLTECQDKTIGSLSIGWEQFTRCSIRGLFPTTFEINAGTTLTDLSRVPSQFLNMAIVSRDFIVRVSSTVIHPKAEIIQVRTHRVIMVREGVQSLLVTLIRVLVPMVVFIQRSFVTKQNIFPDSARGSVKGTKGGAWGARGGARSGS
ncbi:hypothetical protein H5410_036132 [Solanum commersonii]|uniref:Uncharacterized protein n=1 Tax=Solanum commersonii TaxID=4109 RepID=A0A9J5Y6N3_SOLCO|nr:hypothetical protein H5410_036132 [Solanum commersonii]